jgi:putative ATPase
METSEASVMERPSIPLAERVRPSKLEDYIGQKHILGKDAGLRSSLEAGFIPSMILWGPPGVGKTSLANLISKFVQAPFYELSAVSSGVKDVREIINQASNKGMFDSKGSILFIDEIHRFSKSQQDSLLSAVEKGIVTLIGATTENPSFEVISALLSRCQVYQLNPFSKDELIELLKNSIIKDEYLQNLNIEIKDHEALLRYSGGDGRKLLTLFELVIDSSNPKTLITITNELVSKVAQQSLTRYDKSGDQHYDIVSAFIKSIRGSDPNAAIYWLARMIEGGEDPKFIARRLLISASEDIGLANPTALILANSTFESIQKIGMPESRIILAQCTIYLATSPKGNSAYNAINEAIQIVQKTNNLPVPLDLRNAPTKLMKEIGYGQSYQYDHDFKENFSGQEFMPNELVGKNFFKAGDSKKEKEIQEFILQKWKGKYA